MHEPEVYETWECAPATWLHRSHFYSLPPIGVGTAEVESLTGYIARLAKAPAVETGSFVNHELLPRIPYTKGASAGHVPTKLPNYCMFLDAYALNGPRERTQRWVSLLEKLTCVDRLDLLTLLPWANTISTVHLLRTHRAWCPYCYGVERLTESAAYERLLWSFQVVTACPNHRCPLESLCWSCGRTQYMFSAKSRPGYCSRCRCWLGRESAFADHDLTVAIRIATMVGELLAASPSLPSGFGLSQFQANMRSLTDTRQFRDVFRHRNIRGWRNHGNAPNLESLTAISLSQDISMLRLLTEAISSGRDVDSGISPHAHFRVSRSTAEVALRAALQDAFPPSLQELATRIGYGSVSPLKARFRALCDEIVCKRRSARRDSLSPPYIVVHREQIEQALSEALGKDGPTSLYEIASTIGLRNIRRLYKGFHELRDAVVAKNRRIRADRVTTIESALQAACYETPPPTVTEVAHRLGYKAVGPVTKRFPELTASLRRLRTESSPARDAASSRV